MKTKSIAISLGESGEEFLSRNGLEKKKSVDRQPAGLNFYRVRWPTTDRGSVRVSHGDFSFTIKDVLSVKGTEDSERKDSGIFDYTVNFGMAGGGMWAMTPFGESFNNSWANWHQPVGDV